MTGVSRLRQVHADPGRAGAGAAAPLRQGHRNARAARPPAGRRPPERCGVCRPVADRQDRALQPGELCRRLGRDARAVCRRAAVPPAQLHRQPSSASTAATGAARPAAARASSMWRCSSSATSTCAARTATANATGPKSWRSRLSASRRRRASALLNVADVLDLTVSEAAALFAQRPRGDPRAAAHRRRGPGIREAGPAGAHAVGRRGAAPQARRLPGRGAPRRASASRQPLARKGTLFLFDEPTTGLHFDDIAKLMRALRKLLDAGHSLIVIEHNLDVIRAADWLIDLGPEGGDAGGLLVAEGTPEEVRLHASSHTGQALREYDAGHGRGARRAKKARPLQLIARRTAGRAIDGRNAIQIVNAKEHNLKILSVDIPRGKFNVVTGVCGSGKSTLAFDILFNEGQRRYLEIAQRLCAQHRAAGGPARGGRGLRHSAHGGDRAAPVARRAQEHGGHHHRGLALPAPAVRQAGHAALRPRRRGGDAADARQHRRAAAEAVTAASTSACWRRW